MGVDVRRLVVFDFDGTLADTWRDIATALNDTLREARLPAVEGPEVRYWIGMGVLPLLERAVPPPHRSPSRLDELYQRFRVRYEHCCLETTELYPGIAECLEQLSEAPLAIASNKPTLFLERILEGLDLKRLFRAVLGGDSLSVRKPHPGVIQHLVSQFDAPPDEIWMVGDSAIDAETGRSAGARTVGCAWGLRGRQELREAGVDHLVERPEDIPPLILASS